MTATPPPLPVVDGIRRAYDRSMPCVYGGSEPWCAWIPPAGPESADHSPPFGVSFHPTYEAAAEYVREHTTGGAWAVVRTIDGAVVDRFDTEQGARGSAVVWHAMASVKFDPLPVRSAWYATNVLGRES